MNVLFAPLFKSTRRLGVLALLVTVAASAATSSAAPSIKILRGAGQQTTYASAFPAPLVVWVTEEISGSANVRPVSGLRVNFTPAAGIGLSASYAITDEHGLASVNATGLFACASSVRAELVGAPGTQVRFDGMSVDKAILTVIPADLDANVGGPIPAITAYSIRGFVAGDGEGTAQITGSPVLTTTATDRSPHANYAIKGGVGTLSAPNYTFVAGFGTLAIVGSSDSSQSQEASLAIAGEEPVAVRPALLNQPSANAVRQPAFLAGLRGESGVFVVPAIWQSVPMASARKLTTSIGPVLPTATADLRKASAAPVQAAALPRAAVISSAQSSSLRSGVLPTASAAQSSYALPSVRKAFNPSGTK